MAHRRTRPLETHPHADISINRNRLKKSASSDSGITTLYMANGTEFEIELDNNTQETWLAKIKFNGKSISNSGLVLRPGEHHFIERFLDENRKFLFDTYEVEKGREKAIAKNGTLLVEFYRECKLPKISFATWVTPNKRIPRRKPFFPFEYPKPTFPNPFEYFTTCGSGEYTGSITYTMGQIQSNLLKGETSKGLSEGSIQCSVGSEPQMLSANFMETGRVEKGSESKQEFTDVDIDFESFCSHRVDYQILPLSQKKFIENKEIRQYCTDCGRRRKKSENFCPTDGVRY